MIGLAIPRACSVSAWTAGPVLYQKVDERLSGRLAVVVVEQAAKAFVSKNAAVLVRGLWGTIDQKVFEALVISLSMIMLNEF